MSAIKTAISISDTVFQDVEALAKEWHVSRSEIFAKAVQAFIEKQKNLKRLEALNQLYAKGPTEEEKKQQHQSLKRSLKVIDPW